MSQLPVRVLATQTVQYAPAPSQNFGPKRQKQPLRCLSEPPKRMKTLQVLFFAAQIVKRTIKKYHEVFLRINTSHPASICFSGLILEIPVRLPNVIGPAISMKTKIYIQNLVLAFNYTSELPRERNSHTSSCRGVNQGWKNGGKWFLIGFSSMCPSSHCHHEFANYQFIREKEG